MEREDLKELLRKQRELCAKAWHASFENVEDAIMNAPEPELPESTATVSDWKERFKETIVSALRNNNCEMYDELGNVEKGIPESSYEYAAKEAVAEIEENIITPQAPKEVREVEDCVLVPFPDKQYRDGAEIKTWMDGWLEGYRSKPQVSLSLPKGECYMAIDFARWYSGMEKQKVLSAFERYKKEIEGK